MDAALVVVRHAAFKCLQRLASVLVETNVKLMSNPYLTSLRHQTGVELMSNNG